MGQTKQQTPWETVSASNGGSLFEVPISFHEVILVHAAASVWDEMFLCSCIWSTCGIGRHWASQVAIHCNTIVRVFDHFLHWKMGHCCGVLNEGVHIWHYSVVTIPNMDSAHTPHRTIIFRQTRMVSTASKSLMRSMHAFVLHEKCYKQQFTCVRSCLADKART